MQHLGMHFNKKARARARVCVCVFFFTKACPIYLADVECNINSTSTFVDIRYCNCDLSNPASGEFITQLYSKKKLAACK